MPKRSKEEFMKSLSDFIGDNKSDAALALLEDAADSFDGADVGPYETEIAELKAKNEALDAEWRERYAKRFTDYTPQTIPQNEVEDSVIESDETPATTDGDIADLFE